MATKKTAGKKAAPVARTERASGPVTHAEAHAERIEQMLEQPDLKPAHRKELEQTLAGYRDLPQ